MADSVHSRQYVSKLVPSSGSVLLACIIATSVVDSVLLGYDSSLMGSLNVMPEYYNYFHLTTATKSLNTAISYTGGTFFSHALKSPELNALSLSSERDN
jgi:hypothetical protein